MNDSERLSIINWMNCTKSRWRCNKTFEIWLKDYLKRHNEAFFSKKRGKFGYIWCGWNCGMKSDRSTAWDLLHCPRNRIESSFFRIGSIRTFHCILGFSAVPGREVGKRPFTHLGIVPYRVGVRDFHLLPGRAGRYPPPPGDALRFTTYPQIPPKCINLTIYIS